MTIVTIDGPAGAGKTTAARTLAARRGCDYLDTGAMYRAVTALALRCGIDVADEDAVAELAEAMDLVVADRVVADGHDVTAEIRGDDVASHVSAVARQPRVREELQRRQRDWAAARTAAVVEGRDIGTAVLPDAAVRVLITARPEVRAARRRAESTLDKLDAAANLAHRDATDSGRAHSPLPDAEGAAAAGLVVIDTSDLTVEEVVDVLADLVDAATGGAATGGAATGGVALGGEAKSGPSTLGERG